MIKKNYYLLNVPGKHGYSFMVLCDAKDEEEAVSMAADAELFKDPEDADYCIAEEASESDIEHWMKYCTIEEI